jgi:hypothetical protein
MGIYDSELLKWFTDEFPKHSNQKTGYGKSCIRFKNRSNPISLDSRISAKVTSRRMD